MWERDIKGVREILSHHKTRYTILPISQIHKNSTCIGTTTITVIVAVIVGVFNQLVGVNVVEIFNQSSRAPHAVQVLGFKTPVVKMVKVLIGCKNNIVWMNNKRNYSRIVSFLQNGKIMQTMMIGSHSIYPFAHERNTCIPESEVDD